MRWTKYSIETKASAEEAVCALLMEAGIDAFEIEDNQIVPESIEKEGGYFEELMPDLPDDDTARIIFYLEEGSRQKDALLKVVKDGLFKLSQRIDTGSGKISVSVSDEADWRDAWKSYFHAFSIGDIWIKPTWEALPEGADPGLVLQIDPGISFGTGQHETTKMCIKWLQKYLSKGDRLLDIGFGSGILSIAAIKLGAAMAVGTDIDSDCLQSVRENFLANGISEDKGSFFIGDLATDDALAKKVLNKPYDAVTANILADIVIGLKERVYDALKEGGVLIASGIIDFKEDAVRDALLSGGFDIIDYEKMGEWVSLVAKKR